MEDSCFSVTRDNSANQLFYTKYLIACHLPCFIWAINFKREMVKKIFLIMEESGIEPETFRMRSGRSTTELHPHSVTFPPFLAKVIWMWFCCWLKFVLDALNYVAELLTLQKYFRILCRINSFLVSLSLDPQDPDPKSPDPGSEIRIQALGSVNLTWMQIESLSFELFEDFCLA